MAAFLVSREAMSALLGVEVPPEWPVFPESITYWQENPDKLTKMGGWISYLFIHRQDGKLVGDGGYKGKPDRKGRIEIGYALIPGYRGKGLATEAMRALMDRTFERPEIKSVYAETLSDAQSSMRVVQKLGMTFDGIARTDARGDVFRWQVSRDEYFEFHNPNPAQPDTSACGSASLQSEPFLGYTFTNPEQDKENNHDHRT